MPKPCSCACVLFSLSVSLALSGAACSRTDAAPVGAGSADSTSAARDAAAPAASSACGATATRTAPSLVPFQRKGTVTFPETAVIAGDASLEDRRSVIDAVVDLREAWIAMDRDAFLSRTASDVVRMPQTYGRIESGPDEIAKSLDSEWDDFERPNGALGITVTVRDASLRVAGDTAVVSYWADVLGSDILWPFDDTWFVAQAFVRIDGRWLLVHETEGADLSSSGDDAFHFDFAYPVDDLDRAVAFYQPILGDPEAVTEDGAIFGGGGGSHFLLDKTKLGGLANVRPGLPSGYGIFFVPDVTARMTELRAAGATFLGDVVTQGTDRYVIGLDSSENVFVLKEVHPDTNASYRPSSPSGADPSCQSPATDLLGAWLRGDTDHIGGLLAEDAAWFDDARPSSDSPLARGRSQIGTWLPNRWTTYDRSSAGLAADLSVQSMAVRPLGTGSVTSFRMTLTGKGPHPYREPSLVTVIADSRGKITDVFIVRSDSTGAMARSVDYTGYPVTDLEAANTFYNDTMKLGERYSDDEYYGWWSDNSVFGVYTAVPSDDHIPVARQANGYVSFWISSAQSTYDYLHGKAVKFPIIPAINDVSGIDPQPGYTQVVAEDSEGNVVIYGEYTGTTHPVQGGR